MSEKYDVLIVGGGIVGLCSAFYLQQAGARVLVVDRAQYSEGASTGNAGMIVPSHIIPLSAPGAIARGIKWLMNPESPLYIRPRANPAFLKWLWLFQKHCTDSHVQYAVPILRDLSLLSVELLDEMCSLPGFENVALTHNGLLMLHNSDKAAADNEDLADIAERAGLDIERLNRDETLELEPALKTDMTGSVFFRQDASIDPEKLLRALETRLRAGGAQFEEGEVTAFERSDGSVRSVILNSRRIRADSFVLAAGSWTPILTRKLGANISVQPAKGYSITVPVDQPAMRIPCVVTDEKVTITPMPGCIRFGGTLALQGFDSSIDMRRALPIRRQAERYCDGVAEIETWSGFRPASPDGLPFIGALPSPSNVVVATGHGMMGVTLGPVTGQLVAGIIRGNAPCLDVTPFRIGRH